MRAFPKMVICIKLCIPSRELSYMFLTTIVKGFLDIDGFLSLHFYDGKMRKETISRLVGASFTKDIKLFPYTIYVSLTQPS